MRVLLALMLLLVATPLVAQTALPPAPYANRELEDPAQEAKARDLMATIRCVTCQSQSIADSNASMASDLRSLIRERIKAGEQPEHIRSWLIERYGNWISYKPTADEVTWPLWAAPLLLLLAGAGIAATRLRGRRSRRKDAR